MIDGADKQEGEIKAALVEKGYEELRGLSEIVVEHEMLKGVVQRYAPNVMMTKLDTINVGKLQESMAAIMPVFDESCRYMASHSQPPETQGIRPTLDELKADYETVLRAREPHKGQRAKLPGPRVFFFPTDSWDGGDCLSSVASRHIDSR